MVNFLASKVGHGEFRLQKSATPPPQPPHLPTSPPTPPLPAPPTPPPPPSPTYPHPHPPATDLKEFEAWGW